MKRIFGLLFIIPLVTLVACLPSGKTEPPETTAQQTHVGNAQTACQLDKSLRHKTTRDGTRKVLYDGNGAIAFMSNYAVNTDGAPNSYHPDDLGGSKGLAINTICNGANATSANGTRYNYKQCQKLIDTFRSARSEGWTKPGGARMDFYGVAKADKSGAVPCISKNGKYAGYMVSTTSLLANASLGRCEQGRYLDALETNFIIRPGSKFDAIGMELGDVAAVLNTNTGNMQFAVVGDTGPSTGLGEGSVALLQRLANRSDAPRTRKGTYAYGLNGVVTVILPNAKISGKVDQKSVDELGFSALAAFGGKPRVQDCAKALAAK